MKKSQPASAPAGPTIDAVLVSWERAMRGVNRSPRTVQNRLGILRAFRAWCEERARDIGVDRIRREDVQDYLIDCLARMKPGSARTYHATLKVFFGWLIEEGDIAANPMERVKAPKVPWSPPIILADADMERMIRACEGRDFESLRDTAILRMFDATPLRRTEMATLRVADVDLDTRVVRAVRKGGAGGFCKIDHATARAVDRYIRRGRAHHPHASSERLWLGRQGPLSGQGLYCMWRKRAVQAGLGDIRILPPHSARRAFAHGWLDRGGSEIGLRRLAGWSRNSDQPMRYAEALADERALKEYDRIWPKKPGE